MRASVVPVELDPMSSPAMPLRLAVLVGDAGVKTPVSNPDQSEGNNLG